MNHLLKELAPIPEEAWSQIDDEARNGLRTHLAARRLVDFRGPLGWSHSAHNLGRTTLIDAPAAEGVEARTRRVLPLVELRIPFRLARADVDDAARGDGAIELQAVADAAKAIALAENIAVFHGYPAAGIAGITETSPHTPVAVSDAAGDYAKLVTTAIERLRLAGVDGPYGLALGPAAWTTVVEGTEQGGYPLLRHLGEILDGPIVWAPGVEGGIVLSQRGGDAVLESGQDLSIGYLHHGPETVTLFLEESFTFRMLQPEAAVALQM